MIIVNYNKSTNISTKLKIYTQALKLTNNMFCFVSYNTLTDSVVSITLQLFPVVASDVRCPVYSIDNVQCTYIEHESHVLVHNWLYEGINFSSYAMWRMCP